MTGTGRPDAPKDGPDTEQAPRLPLFPLGTVLFPGLAMPLLIFEDRYRAMLRDLLRLPQHERRFGVVAIREGYEVAVGDSPGRQSSYRTGCEAQLLATREEPKGFSVETVGTRRFRVQKVHTAGEYVTADVLHLGEPVGDGAATQAVRALAAFESYRLALARSQGAEVVAAPLAAAPLELSYALAATVPLPLSDRQALLEIPDADSRLARLSQLLGDELLALRAVPSLPATSVARTSWSPN